MASCEEWPCCGHEAGCCPDYDPETGRQLNMKCTCGATVPLTSKVSICQGCLNGPSQDERGYTLYDDDDDPGPDEEPHDPNEWY
jgi:hypothetical protein